VSTQALPKAAGNHTREPQPNDAQHQAAHLTSKHAKPLAAHHHYVTHSSHNNFATGESPAAAVTHHSENAMRKLK
jgi:hypothetical protein